MTGSELRELLSTHKISSKAVATDIGVSASSITRMMHRDDIGATNAMAIRYIIHQGVEERMLEPAEVLPLWGSSRQSLSAYSGVSLKHLYMVINQRCVMTPRLSMAIRQAVIDRDVRREQSRLINVAVFLAQNCSIC